MASQPQNGAQPRFLGRYELMYLLGQGGMGEVHLARLSGAAGFEKLCIVKTILPQMMTDPQFVDRFHHEAKVLTHLTHSNIAQVYDMEDASGTLFMAIEYVAGVDLSRVEDRVRAMGTTVPIPISVMIGQQMCEALGYAHRKVGADGAVLGIVHRDVSPQNLMVSYEGEVKVIDFGLAKSTARSKHTLPSTVLGKLGYMSPEQAKGERVDHRSDIYSAGIVIWELLAGRPLFQGGTVGEMVAQMAFPKIPSLREIQPEISEALDRTVMRALVADPAGRYNRADDFARGLNELLVRENMSVSSEEVGNYVRSMCPEEFAAERQLQSKLSAERKKGSSSPAVKSQSAEFAGTAIRSPATNAAAKMDGTLLRTPAPTPPPMTAAQKAMSGVVAAPASQRPPSTPRTEPETPAAVSEEIRIPKSRGPMIGLILALIVLGGGGTAAFLISQKKETPPVEPVAKTDLPKIEVPKTDPVAVAKVEEPVKKEEPAKEEPPQKEEPPAQIERAEIKGEVFPVLVDEGKLYVNTARNKKIHLAAGDELRVVGAPIAGSLLRDVYGSGVVMDMKGPTLGRIDEAVKPPKGVPLFAVLEKGAVAAAAAKQQHKGAFATAAANANPGTEPAKKEEPAKGEPAKVDPTGAQKLEDKGGDPAKPAEPPKPAEPVKAAGPVLTGNFTRSTWKGIILNNTTTFRWTDCEVHTPFKKWFRFDHGETIEPQDSNNIRGGWKVENREPDEYQKKGYAIVRCAEGSAYLKWDIGSP